MIDEAAGRGGERVPERKEERERKSVREKWGQRQSCKAVKVERVLPNSLLPPTLAPCVLHLSRTFDASYRAS